MNTEFNNFALTDFKRRQCVVMLLNYFFALPGYIYLNAVTGTGATKTVFFFQVITTVAYLFCLWGLSNLNVRLATYWSVEYLYVIMLGIQSFIYLKLYNSKNNRI